MGAFASEVEFQRYRPRALLTQCLSRCDVIQVVCGSPAWANAVVGAGKPISLHAASLAHVERRKRCEEARGVGGWWRRRMTAVTQRLDEKALRRADAIQVMNPWMLEYAIGLNAGREVDIRYAPPGIDSSRFCPSPVRDIEGNRYILCVGRLDDPRKNVGLLLEAYAQLRTDLKTKVRLVLAGASGPPSALWQRAAALGLTGRVSFVERPQTDELVSLYQQASVLALPSDEEGFGIVLLEAMACGVPVVSTRCGGPDGIVTDGKDGYLVGLDNAEELSNRLSRLLDDPNLNRDMGLAARRKIEETYAQKVAGRVFIEIWNALLARGRVARCAG